MGVVIFNSTSNMRIFITPLSLPWQSAGAISVMTVQDQSAQMEPRLCITDPQEKILKIPIISLHLYAMEKESPPVPMDQRQESGSTSVAMMRRSAPLGKGLGQETSHVLPVLMGPSVPVQEEGRTVRSVSKCAPIGRAVLHSVRREFHTAPGGPRTGTNMTGLGTSTQGQEGQETDFHTNGEVAFPAINLNSF